MISLIFFLICRSMRGIDNAVREESWKMRMC